MKKPRQIVHRTADCSSTPTSEWPTGFASTVPTAVPSTKRV